MRAMAKILTRCNLPVRRTGKIIIFKETEYDDSVMSLMATLRLGGFPNPSRTREGELDWWFQTREPMSSYDRLFDVFQIIVCRRNQIPGKCI